MDFDACCLTRSVDAEALDFVMAAATLANVIRLNIAWGCRYACFLFAALLPSFVLAGEPPKPTCAVLTLDARAGITADEAAFLSDRFEVELGQLGQFTMMSRENMGRVLEAQQFSLTCGGTECAIEAGRLLSIQHVVFGSIGKVGQFYSVNVSMAHVETGAIEKQASYDSAGDVGLLLTSGMEQAARKLMGLDAGPVVVQATTNEEGHCFVRGEVARPGKYPLAGHTTVLQAVLAAGGYTEYANARNVKIIRGDRVIKVPEIEAEQAEDLRLEPNDIIVVQRRIFL